MTTLQFSIDNMMAWIRIDHVDNSYVVDVITSPTWKVEPNMFGPNANNQFVVEKPELVIFLTDQKGKKYSITLNDNTFQFLECEVDYI